MCYNSKVTVMGHLNNLESKVSLTRFLAIKEKQPINSVELENLEIDIKKILWKAERDISALWTKHDIAQKKEEELAIDEDGEHSCWMCGKESK